MQGQCNLHRTKRLICGGCGYSDIKDLPTSNEAGRSLGKSPSPLAMAGLAP